MYKRKSKSLQNENYTIIRDVVRHLTQIINANTCWLCVHTARLRKKKTKPERWLREKKKKGGLACGVHNHKGAKPERIRDFHIIESVVQCTHLVSTEKRETIRRWCVQRTRIKRVFNYCRSEVAFFFFFLRARAFFCKKATRNITFDV